MSGNEVVAPATGQKRGFFGWISLIWNIFIEAAVRIAIRLFLWTIAIVGALTPPLYAANVRPTFDVTAMATQVNNAGLFKDLVYVTVVLSLLGICEILAVFLKFKRPRSEVLLFYVVAFGFFFYYTIVGIGEFAHLAAVKDEHHIVPEAQFLYDLSGLWVAGTWGFALELVLAFQGE